jgi:uncharacterized protein YcbK (DUF882 family)
MTRGPSPHLTWAELACKDATPYPPEWVADRLMPLAQEFENLRALAGHRPMTVLSAYRTKAHNARVGGARNSQHVQGRALDLKPPTGMSVQRLYELALEMTAQAGCRIRGIARYPTFVHIDIRPSDRLVNWTGARKVADAG